MTRSPASIVLVAIIASGLSAQNLRTFSLQQSAAGHPPGNSVNELVSAGDTLWTGTGRGLGYRIGLSSAWTDLSSHPVLRAAGVSGIAVDRRVVWASYATTTKQEDQNLPTGNDLFRTLDGGASWTLVPQPVDAGTVDTLLYGINRIATLNITTKVNNITYDIAARNGIVWIASFAGMLRRSADSGATWQRVILPPDSRDSIRPTDTLDFDLAPTGGRLGLRGNLNHRAFSVTVTADGTVWAGTAGGVNRSTDGGVTWRKFSRQNQASPISGNFVVAVREQRWPGRSRIWAATVNAESDDETRGVSYTDDNGETWATALLGEFAHNFAFKDSVVYVATDRGLYRSGDLGTTWTRTGTIADAASHARLTSPEMITVAVQGDTVWVAGPDGLAWTLDTPAVPFGSRWTVVRTAQPVAGRRTTYSYPLPFSPDEEVVRIRYDVPAGTGADISIRIFDYGMLPVRTLVHRAPRTPGREYDEIWDGRTDNGAIAANGVYFYSLTIGDAEPLWGKIMVLQ